MQTIGITKTELAEFLEVAPATLKKHALSSGLMTVLPKIGSNRATFYGPDVAIIERYFGKCHLLRRHFGIE